ncbi:MAG: tripartite tricarboxylate transporter TctB family protein [Betaproteobacteria bacterium]|jgi:predicted membrane channel-forming protein YqfA (hemolysin III family)|nr:tripartite tricarboxylate transporter TctB family protein [Burkholderiales bacterium]NBX15408.1 tripartite tricarboxylate transporter TctB family protein [Betaproteobacteria bacterium]NBX88683.1 tripartite tricarboxylate transporter TctB family protein [Betaproteobacteria bacterium]
MSSQESSEETLAAATHTVEAVVAVCVLALGLLIMYGSRNLGSEWTSDGPGAGYFPFYIGLILCISSVGIFIQALFGKAKNTGAFVDHVQLRRVLQVFIPALIYVGAVQVLGIYVASAVYIALFMVYLGEFSWLKSSVAAVFINVVFFLMFEVWFKVPLFKGTLNPLAFLGY